jgi:hypothetical protein
LTRAKNACPRGLIVDDERSRGVVLVFELDHRLILLEPFQRTQRLNCPIISFRAADARVALISIALCGGAA